MNNLLQRAFGLERLRPGEPGVAFGFSWEIPVWAWVLVISTALAIAFWSYTRLLAPRWARSALAILRTLTLVFLVFLLAGPQLSRQDERIERDWVVVMADRSASMTVADAPGSTTRDSQLGRALAGAWPTLARLRQERNVLFLGFDAGAFDLAITSAGGVDTGVVLGAPAGRRTDLSQALEQALRRVVARPVAGVVLLSDGRTGDPPARALVRQLQAEKIPVFALALGSPDPLGDLALRRFEAPSPAFVGDVVPVTVDIERLGDFPGGEARLELIDNATGLTLDSRPIVEADGTTARVTLLSRPARPGVTDWSVRLVTDRPDLSRENDTLPVAIELIDRPIRVVYFDGYPRWEYRYLKNLLVRERTFSSAVQLMASDRRFIQEGTDPLDVLPDSPEAWSKFDVIVLGDMRPELFGAEQLNQIRDVVAQRGAGLLWIGGGEATPARWADTPLADLLPFSLSAGPDGDGGLRLWTEPITVERAPVAERLGLLELADTAPGIPSLRTGWPRALADPATGWSRLNWGQRIPRASVKPAAEVLALALPSLSASPQSDATPLVLTMRFGAGRVVYVATDETWRWRYGRGESLFERFWIPLLRLLARDSLARSGKPALLEVAPRLARVEQPVRVIVRIADQSVLDPIREGITVRLRRENDPGAPPVSVTLTPEIGPDGRPSGVYAATWVPSEPGAYVAEPADTVLAALDISARAEVVLPDDELRTPQADHAILAALTQQTGGQMLEASQLNELDRLLPNRQIRLLSTPEVETLWDKPLMLIIFLTLLALEWMGRKLVKLV